ncbi:hypothetical protein DFH27DRAFT_477206 [Peziza echinospora]|nr:hypothetical protein DFH27DRAFT_477206 [Peziza echinospora]
MATTAAPLKVTFLGALQASLTVILTLAYGVLAARRNLIGSESARDLSKLCVQMFLPMLILTTVGAEMGGGGGWGRYGVIVLWSLTYTTLSILYGKISERVLGCPTWTTPACSFNNTTSLPLLLVQSLATTGLLDTLAGGSGDVSGAVERAKAYFLINSMISNSFTFAAGPRLLKEDGEDGNRSRSGVRGSRGLRRRRGGQRNTIRGRRHAAPAPAPLHGAVDPDGKDRRIVGLVNPAMVGTALAVFVAVVPPLNRAMFGEVKDGALLKGWFTSSLKNVGDLFTVLQMFVVGVKLNESMFGKKKEKAEDGDVPIKALAVIYALRFAIWPAISISFIYALAKRHLVSNDPILWFAMMIMPVGPPAILLSSLSELEGNEGTKLEMAKMLFISYSVSPVICFAIVGAMKACESLVAS